jgi:ceramide glucosyltransferase
LIWIALLPAAGYQCLAIYAALRHLLKRYKVFAPSGSRLGMEDSSGASGPSRSRLRSAPEQAVGVTNGDDSAFSPGVSVLKPLQGLDLNTYEAFVSHIQQRYPTFEVLFGVRHEDDPAVAEVHRLRRDFPDAPVRLIIGAASAANGKVGVLMELAHHAQYPIWVVNDSDIKVTPNYLSNVVAPLSEPFIGLVTCLYRARGHSLPATWEALGIATDFMPSTLVAPLIGVREFGLGSTLAFRVADLERLGGFAVVADYLADDYQLAKQITGLGKRVLLSTHVVETSVNDSTWRGVWEHQLRWARTIRVSKGRSYAGLPITHAGLWALIAAVCGAWVPATILLAASIMSAFITGGLVLQSRLAAGLCWLAPVWDVYAFAVWAASYLGKEVRWRDRRLSIDAQGRIRI